MTDPPPSPTNTPARQSAKVSRLPSFRVRCALAASLFALGIALGAAVGPTPQSSLAGQATPPNKLISSLLSRYADTSPVGIAQAPASAGRPTSRSATAIPTTPALEPSNTTPASSLRGLNSPSSSPRRPSNTGRPSAGAGAPLRSGPSPAPLAAIQHVWLILLPGPGFTSAQAQASADPYLSQQLVAQGTLLSNYTPLAAGALSASAALLSGQGAPQESFYTAPGCDTATQPTCTPGSAAELTDVDTYLRQLIPQITASADYREHGLIAIAFSTPVAGPPPSATSSAPSAGSAPNTGSAPSSSSPVPPAATALTTKPQGVLLLSPFLRRPGAQSATPFHPATPRKDLERLLRG